MIILGIDTSNYTTSAALFDTDKGIIGDERKLLPVKEGQLGLRQSDAVFSHTVQLPQIIQALFENCPVKPEAVSVTVTPDEREGSYMPCFLVGKSVATGIASSCGIPLKTFSHQASHIAAAVYSSGRTDLFGKEFIAFHVSGGTTQAVKVTPDENKVFNCELVAESLDLKAGQAIDRVGKMLGLSFPAGKELDALSQMSKEVYKIKPFMKDGNPSLSGIENKCAAMIKDDKNPEDIAKYCISYVVSAIDNMATDLEKRFPGLPLVFSGGVMSNSMARSVLTQKHNAVFAHAKYSSDNACGTAVLASL